MSDIYERQMERMRALGLHERMSVRDVERVYREAGLFRPLDYVKDRDMKPCYTHLKTPADLRDFARRLNEDAERLGPAFGLPRTCSKALGLLELADALADDGRGEHYDKYWTVADHILLRVSARRRVCCGCHETGSYALASVAHAIGAGAGPVAL